MIIKNIIATSESRNFPFSFRKLANDIVVTKWNWYVSAYTFFHVTKKPYKQLLELESSSALRNLTTRL